MRNRASWSCRTIDERLEHAGGHRFLGMLYFETMNYPLVAVGDLDDALRHLERACELFPEYGLNQLALAEVYLEDEEFEEARRRLAHVFQSPPPQDESRAHAGWVARARKLQAEIEGH